MTFNVTANHKYIQSLSPKSSINVILGLLAEMTTKHVASVCFEIGWPHVQHSRLS